MKIAGLNCEIGWKTRLCEVGYFHLWEQWTDIQYHISPLGGSRPGGQIGRVRGIVEFKDGVQRVKPEKIRYCDEENAMLAEMARHKTEEGGIG